PPAPAARPGVARPPFQPPPAPTPGAVEEIPFVGAGRPEGDQPVEPGDFLFDVARPGGGIRRVDAAEAGEGVDAWVFLGTPRMHRTAYTEDGAQVEALTIKANNIVAWVDRAKALESGDVMGLPLGGGGAAGEGRQSTSIIPQALLGVYAEGAVKISFGSISFEAEELYIEPHTYRALMRKVRVDGRSIGVGAVEEPLAVNVRAERARIVSRGLTVFDNAEMATSRHDDRIYLQLRSLTAEELQEALDENGVARTEIMGFYADSSQWYSGRTLTLRGERLPLLVLPRVDFGFSETTEAFTSPIRSLDAGNKGEVGRHIGLDLQFPIGPSRAPWFTLWGGPRAYSKRGVGGLLGAEWNHTEAGRPVRTQGDVETWGVFDNRSFDSDDYVAPHDFRWRVVSESRTQFGRDLTVDHEFSEFSDRGVNNEFFERDDLHHKDRESYLRARWQPRVPGNLVVTLDGKWHQRDFVTETTQMPEVGVWLVPLPLLRPRRRGGLSLDLTTITRAGYLGRRYDEILPDTDYEAWRLHSDTLLNAGVDLGDVRLTAHVGASGSVYAGRTDDGKDLERAALLTGLRANLQLWRVFQRSGGWLELNGLRHVVDMDAELYGRFFDSHEPADVPYFDLHESERERTSVVGRWRNRLQTRRKGSERELATPESGTPILSDLRTVADLEIGVRYFADNKGPFGLESSGDVECRFYGEVKPGLELSGEIDIDFDRGVQTGFVGAGWRTELRDRPFSLFAGHRYVKNESASLTGDASWRFSDRYAVLARATYDFDQGEDNLRLIFRRYSDDHIIVFGFNVRNRDDFGVEFSFEPAIGGRTTEGPGAFKDFPNTDPWGSFRR
ncbi:MAG: hypothetical protein P1V36_11010, partial [Planctomycetota bacterium]|nr:hypothetical protein [Planctomycetota bacterium]